MLVAALAASNVDSLFLPSEAWQRVYEATPDERAEDRQSFLRADESLANIQAYIDRAAAAFTVLRERLQAQQPTAVVVLAPYREPLAASFTSSEVTVFSGARLSSPDARPDLSCDASLAAQLQSHLSARGFDVADCSGINAESGEIGPAMFKAIAPALGALLGDTAIPIVPLFLNTSRAPMPSAVRCIEMGGFLKALLEPLPERVALVGLGGLSHDALGRWIDEPLDRSVLEAFQQADMQRLGKLFTFDSENLRGPTGEIRTWITVAAASGKNAELIDYFPARQGKTGIGFAWW